MREIKFRAWHTAKKKMYLSNELGQDDMTISANGQGFINVSGVHPRFSEPMPWLIPMQYTGLKDKNGREIYEGDILTYPNDSFGRKYSISWADIYAGFWFAPLPIDGVPQYGGHITLANAVVSEVIGNIYENEGIITND